MAVILETKATKDEILELYLNDVYLGHRGSFAHARRRRGLAHLLRQGRHATSRCARPRSIAGVIQSPSTHSPFNNPERARERRNVVLRAMADADFITADAAERAAQGAARGGRPRALDNEAPYFVDYRRPGARRRRSRASPPSAARSTSTRRSTCNLQRSAQDAVRDGHRQGRRSCSPRRKRSRHARRRRWSPSIRAPARSSRWSAGAPTTSRSSTARSIARRQPGSTFKPFVYLAAFEQRGRGRPRRPHAGDDRRSTSRRRSTFDDQEWTPRNYDGEYDGADHAAPRAGACRATSPPSRWPSRPATTRSPRSGGKARRRHAAAGVSRRSRSASSS